MFRRKWSVCVCDVGGGIDEKWNEFLIFSIKLKWIICLCYSGGFYCIIRFNDGRINGD